MKFYGIWCKDEGDGDWLRELPSRVQDGGEAIIAYASIRAAWSRAAGHYGYHSYTAVKRDGWCEVRALSALPEPPR